ncbi:LOW QUALITY PROTEIN: Transposon Tf2-11 polyprotein [Frankliniella fusca]|uniref:Transposon Tf2-11 polyprotein n=1 Tax=Frankliniella fusca TaxID=407009 RepID=A0AAE1L981_9NEOP|nr:LOW QUALITY PROTEIN: Transposon Tf2-11 polyprotein [Frankliniella fusca]
MSPEAKALSAHRGINSVSALIARRWPGFSLQYRDYVKHCGTCQRVNTAVLKVKDPLCSVAPPRQNLQQIGVDIIQLPEADGLKFVVVAIDYLSKYSHAKALVNKSVGEVALFIFEWICLFGCPKVVINDQGPEFVNEVGEHLFNMTGSHQRITSAYNPQANCQQGKVVVVGAVVICFKIFWKETCWGKKYSVYDVLHYLKNQSFPAACENKNDRSNFRKQCKPFALFEGELYHQTHAGKNTDRGRNNATFPGYAKVI